MVLTLIHELDYAFWLFGPARALFAVGGRLGELELDVEDTASILMDCGNAERSLPVHVQVDFLQRPPARTCEIVGSRGRLAVDLVAATLVRYDEAGEVAERIDCASFERNTLFIDEMTHFLACVRGDQQPLVPLDDGIATLRLALAARECMETGRPVSIA